MRKEIVGVEAEARKNTDTTWLDVDSIARVQITSEDPAFPIENAVGSTPSGAGWRASATGPQSIALVFDAPQEIRRIGLHFIEQKEERSQEFVLRYSSAQEKDREIVRQQWTFSPSGSAQESEDYKVQLHGVTRLELVIDPDRGRNQSLATLHTLRLA